MVKKLLIILLIILVKSPDSSVHSQSIDSISFRICSRYSFYSSEGTGEFLLHIPPAYVQSSLSVAIMTGEKILATWTGKPGKEILRIPFTPDFSPSTYKISAKITIVRGAGKIFRASTDLIVLKHKVNEAKSDLLTGGIIVNRRPFFPFGFYCYSPVSSALIEDETVRGFNMISPYQKILPETLETRKAYMDRCAQTGIKVHYNLLSVSGGGGVDSKINGLSPEEKRKRLINEIRTFMDHPALLAWYIADEPNGYKIPPDSLVEIYRLVKETDPWHPVSMVFMSPFMSARKYATALDIVMADPYPVPVLPVKMVGDVTGQLRYEFTGEKPVWMAIQAFGGGEIWEREPTRQEVRSMTWQAIIRGATGIQYFVRQGPNYFPKSVSVWNECSAIAMEVAELTPWLLSDENAPQAISLSPDIEVTSRIYKGQLLVMAVNKVNQPASVTISVKGKTSGKAKVIFENRSITVAGSIINDRISPYGSQAWLFSGLPSDEMKSEEFSNLLKDPGFENNSSVGVPSACYARSGGDRGATYFTDTRESHSGNHSLRLTTPAEGKGIIMRMFPFQVKAGSTYAISLWAKNDPEQRYLHVTQEEKDRLNEKDTGKQYIEIELGPFGSARFVPVSGWKRYMTFISIPEDTTRTVKTNLIIRMPGQGVAWLDDLKVFEEKR